MQLMTRKKMLIGLGASLTIIAVALLGIALFYTGELEKEALIIEDGVSEPNLIVTNVSEGHVTLGITDSTDLTYGSWRSAGVFGMEWVGGYAQVGPIVKLNDIQVVREFLPVSGKLSAGQAVSLDGSAFIGDPHKAHGISFDDVRFTSDLGVLDAWFVEGDDDTWVIYTHGKGASRRESLRMLPIITNLGLTSLVITYRNDKGAPSSTSGFYDYGSSEWKDLEGAVQYALDNGAKDIVLVGYSMGGAITTNFLYKSNLADKVVAIILDAPMMDFGDVVDFGGERRGLPSALTDFAKFVAAIRLGIDWNALNYLAHVDELAVPVLLFHGDDDRTIHKRLSERFFEARPDLVTYVRTIGAGHVRSWNVDSDRYQAEISSFLDGIVP